MVSKKTMPNERASVLRNSLKLLVAALRATLGSMAEAKATPNKLSGTCTKRMA